MPTMYQVSIPHFVRALTNLSKILGKAATWAEARKIDPLVLTGARLAPDMFPLVRQIQIATDGVKGCAARLAGIEVPSYPDTETTFDELQARIAKTIAFIQSVKAAQIDGSEATRHFPESRATRIEIQGRGLFVQLRHPQPLFPHHDDLRHFAA